MKKHLLIIVFTLCFSLWSKAQWVTIPDANFVAWLNAQGYSQCMSGNQMDTTCPAILTTTQLEFYSSGISDITGLQYFDSLQRLSISGDSITVFPPFPNSVTYFFCADSHLDNLPPLPQSLTYLACGSNHLTSLPILPNSLEELHVSSNPLDSLPSLPNSLKQLDCQANQLLNLPILPTGLLGLYCNVNQLTALPDLPNSLIDLNCDYNLLTSLPTLPSALQNLNCQFNNLTSLPTLPGSLIHLYCKYNQLTALPAIPNALTIISCEHNNLTTTPPLGTYVDRLYCDYNQLTSLGTLNNGLTTLYCRNNYLTTLPPFGNLIVLYCDSNQLTSLPTLPASIKNIHCPSNQLTWLPTLPISWMSGLDCSDNPNLLCLPKLNEIHVLRFLNTGVVCLPNYGSIGSSVPPINSVPLCDSANNINGCQIFSSIEQINLLNSHFIISPNPTTDQLFIETNGIDVTEVTIYSTNGSLVAQTKLGQNRSIDVSSLANGVYIAEMKTKEASVRRRWVKM